MSVQIEEMKKKKARLQQDISSLEASEDTLLTKAETKHALKYVTEANSLRRTVKEEAQLMLTNPRDAFRGQSRSPNSSIPYVRYSLLLYNSNFVFKTIFFLRYSTSKNVVTLKSGSESLKVIERGTIL